jgi:hypothetical protein
MLELDDTDSDNSSSNSSIGHELIDSDDDDADAYETQRRSKKARTSYSSSNSSKKGAHSDVVSDVAHDRVSLLCSSKFNFLNFTYLIYQRRGVCCEAH